MININLKAQGIELTPAISDYSVKKISSIEKYFSEDKLPIVFVEVGKSSGHHKHGPIFRAEVRVSGSGANFYATSESSDLYSAIDLVRDEIIKEITHNKSKRLHLLRSGGRKVKNMIRDFNPFS